MRVIACKVLESVYPACEENSARKQAKSVYYTRKACELATMRHYVATSQGQRWNRIWVTTDICYDVITVNTKMTMLTLQQVSVVTQIRFQRCPP